MLADRLYSYNRVPQVLVGLGCFFLNLISNNVKIVEGIEIMLCDNVL